MKIHKEICRDFDLDPDNLPLGAVVAIASLTDCILMTEGFIAAQTDLERSTGCWEVGRFAWKLENIRAIDPIPVKGKQGLWNLKI